MAGSSTGTIFRLTTFGESHGVALGGVIDGCPANITLDLEAIQYELDRRRPGQSAIVTQRKESDKVQFLSGLFEGKTTGTPIGFTIYNEDSKSKDYEHIKDVFRPSHADYVYQEKYKIRDYRGGGRSSARETVCRVVAGAIAKQVLKDCSIRAYVSSVGELKVTKPYNELNLDNIELNAVRCPDLELAREMEDYIKEVRKQGDSIGGTITCVIENVPTGLGEPVFDKLDAELAKAMLSINAVKGISFGSGFEGTELLGSQHNDVILPGGNTKTNHAGGIVGGISNGMDIVFKIAFKPVATLMKDQESINDNNEVVTITGKGRHDACVVPRAVPIVEAMAALVLMDLFLLQQSRRLY